MEALNSDCVQGGKEVCAYSSPYLYFSMPWIDKKKIMITLNLPNSSREPEPGAFFGLYRAKLGYTTL